MEINLFSKCIKDLIVENDRVDVPYLGSFVAEMRPASYSDRQTTIHPPYRRMTFHKAEITLADGHLLLDKVRREIGVSLDQAGVELGWCLSRLCSELEGRKICKLPGLGVMRANARNEFFFVPDDDLDIWPDGLGFEPISIKVAEKMPDQVAVDVEKSEPIKTPVVELIPETPEQVAGNVVVRPRQRMRPWMIVLLGVAAVVVLFVAACYLFTDQMSPIIDPLLYSKEELELLRGL